MRDLDKTLKWFHLTTTAGILLFVLPLNSFFSSSVVFTGAMEDSYGRIQRNRHRQAKRALNEESTFGAFRYEISHGNNEEIIEYIKREADENACFGWIQESPQMTIVGEIRCRKPTDKKMEKTITENFRLVETKKYDDAKIKLHFSHFKVLDKKRVTCFRDEPHQCEEDDLEL